MYLRIFCLLLTIACASANLEGEREDTCGATLPRTATSRRIQPDDDGLVLPKVTSSGIIVRGEIRAPFHIPCRIKEYNGLRLLKSSGIEKSYTNLKLRSYAQPPHAVFYDKNGQVVESVALGTLEFHQIVEFLKARIN